jgi:hypothetical protein
LPGTKGRSARTIVSFGVNPEIVQVNCASSLTRTARASLRKFCMKSSRPKRRKVASTSFGFAVVGGTAGRAPQQKIDRRRSHLAERRCQH